MPTGAAPRRHDSAEGCPAAACACASEGARGGEGGAGGSKGELGTRAGRPRPREGVGGPSARRREAQRRHAGGRERASGARRAGTAAVCYGCDFSRASSPRPCFVKHRGKCCYTTAGSWVPREPASRCQGVLLLDLEDAPEGPRSR